jgi:hypothetical protein
MAFKNYGEQALNGIIKVETKEFVKNKKDAKVNQQRRGNHADFMEA